MIRCIYWVLSLSMTGSVAAQVVRYDGTAFPEDAGQGWIHLQKVNPADRWIENGWLVQAPIVLPCPPDCRTQDSYNRDLTDQAGLSGWYLRWVMETDGPLALGAVAPAVIAIGDEAAVLYHFTIGKEGIAFLRDPFVPLVVADIEPGPHEYRLALTNKPPTGTFVFTIDGQVISSGAAQGFFPSEFDPLIAFSARAAIVDSVTRWDFIEFGPLPGDPIPAVSTWGVVVLTLFLVTGGTLLFGRQTETGLELFRLD